MLVYREIGTPEHAHGVRSDREYAVKQALHIDRNRLKRPKLPWQSPWEAGEERNAQVVPIINCGRWIVMCLCGNAPSYSPSWQVARCFECGAIYRPRPPAHAAQAEQLLLKRPKMAQRNWTPYESLDELRADNLRHGVEG